MTWTVVAVVFALFGLGDNRGALADGFLLEIVTVVLIVFMARRGAKAWLWLLVPVLVLRGPLPFGWATYLSQGVSSAFGVLTLIAFVLLLLVPTVRRRG